MSELNQERSSSSKPVAKYVTHKELMSVIEIITRIFVATEADDIELGRILAELRMLEKRHG